MKNVFILALICCSFVLISCSDNNDLSKTKQNLNISEQECQTCKDLIILKNSISLSELISLVNSEKIEVKEFTFNDGEMSGGYVLRPGENIVDAVKNFNKKHINFLKEANEIILTNATKENDPVARSGYMTIKKQISTSLININSGKLNVTSFMVASNLTDKVKALSKTNDYPKKVKEESANNPILKSSSHELWAPYTGRSKVTRQMTFQFFYFDNISGFDSNSTYESETQVYDKNYANFDGYWASNLPSAYHDTPFLDDIDNFTIGTSQASLLSVNTMYYTHMTLTQGSAPTAVVRIKGQKGHRYPSNCTSTWCIYPDATTGSLTYFTAPINDYQNWTY